MLISPKLQANSEIPLYIQLYEFLKNEIRTGKLKEDTRLPSVRKLADFLSVSRTIVEMAYDELGSEGLIESVPRKGFYVRSLLELNMDELSVERPTSRNFIQKEETFIYDFHLSQNDFNYFPFSTWKNLYYEALTHTEENNLFYGDPQGEYGLREEISKYLYQVRGVICNPGQVVIGADQFWLNSLLSLLVKASYSHIAIEKPSYVLLPSIFQNMGFAVTPVIMDEEGICLEELFNSPARVVAVNPSHSFPMGTLMSFDRRKEILNWAIQNDGLIIEDDYDGEFRYHGSPLPAIQGLVPDAPVIYIGGFSQVLSPAVCVNYMILPEKLLPAFNDLKSNMLFEQSSSKLHQRTLQLFIERGYLHRHLSKMRTIYRKKHDLLVDAIKSFFRERCKIKGQNAGFHIMLEFQSEKSSKELILLAKKAGIRVSSAVYNKEPINPNFHSFILGFAGIPEDRITEGIKLLSEVWKVDKVR